MKTVSKIKGETKDRSSATSNRSVTMKRKLQIVLAVLLLVTFAGLAIHGISNNRQEIHRQNIELESKEFKLHKIESEFKTLNEQYKQELEKKDSDQQKLKEYEERIRQMEADYKALEISKANQKAEQQRLANAAPRLSATAYAATGCNTGNAAKDFIYMKESGCNPGAINPGGCRGLGQACPGSKLPCSDSDYACQDAWFTNYMSQRYGTWEAAKAHWLARVPINGRDVGHWW